MVDFIDFEENDLDLTDLEMGQTTDVSNKAAKDSAAAYAAILGTPDEVVTT